MHQSKIKHIIKIVAVPLIWLAVWKLLAVAVGQEILIPAPRAVFLSLKHLMGKISFWNAVLVSLFRITGGYLAGVVVGVVGAIISTRSSVFKALFSPILHIIRAVPVASFIILAFVWINSSRLPGFISFLMVMPMILSQVESAIEGIDKKYLELAKVYNLGTVKTFFEIKLPFIFPTFISAAASSLGFAWKSGIAAEVIVRPENSLGGLLQSAKLYIDTPGVFAVTAVVALISLLLELLIKRIATRFTNDKY